MIPLAIIDKVSAKILKFLIKNLIIILFEKEQKIFYSINQYYLEHFQVNQLNKDPLVIAIFLV